MIKAEEVFEKLAIDFTKFVLILHPGLVISIHDGDHHFVGAGELLNCWGIAAQGKIQYLIVQLPHQSDSYMYQRHSGVPEGPEEISRLHLYPDPTGAYDLEKLLSEHLIKHM